MNDLETLTQSVLAFRDAREWKQFHNAKDMALSLLLESSELLEVFQWKQGADIDATVAARKGDIANELADVLYWALLMSHDLGVDLAQALRDKLLANELKYPVDKARGKSTKYTQL